MIEICMYAGQERVEPLIEFVEVMGGLMLKHSYELNNCDFNQLLDDIIESLKKRT
jgi:hypothetical protein